MILFLAACWPSRPVLPPMELPTYGMPMAALDPSCKPSQPATEVPLSPHVEGAPLLAARQGGVRIEAWPTDTLAVMAAWVAEDPKQAEFRDELGGVATQGRTVTEQVDADLGSTWQLFERLLAAGKVRVTWDGGTATALTRTAYWCADDGREGYRWCALGGPCFLEEFWHPLVIG